MKDPKYAHKMLKTAERDFLALSNMLNQDQFAEEIFGFHAQQCVEKSLKALISYHGIVYPKTHAIDTLFKILSDNQITVSESFSDLIDLTEYAVEYRYDVFEMNSSFELDRKLLIEKVKKILLFVQNSIC